MTSLILHLWLACGISSVEQVGRHTRYESPAEMMKIGSRWKVVTCLRRCLSEWKKSENPRRSSMSAVFKLMVLCTIFTKITEPVQERGVEVISTAAMTTPMVEEDVMLRTMEHYVSQGHMRLHIRNQQVLKRAAQAQAPPRKLLLPNTYVAMQTFIAGGVRKTFNSSPGWWCNRFNFPLAILVVQLRAVNPHCAPRTYKRERRS